MEKVIDLINTFLVQKHSKPVVIVICGPTASGKTALSLILAKKFNGEIISADSRQVYRYMDIATDKLLPEKQQGIQHYLIDVVDPDDKFTAGDFKYAAEKYIHEITHKGKLPFIVGGTGLYIDVLINNFSLYKSDHIVRNQLLQQRNEKGNDYLYQQLLKLDPQSAKKIHPHNTQHLIRTIEIVLTTGSPKEPLKKSTQYDSLKIGIRWPKGDNEERIAERVRQQIKRGLVEETKKLLNKYAQLFTQDDSFNIIERQSFPSLSSVTSLGYREIIRYLNHELTLDEAINLLIKNTKKYAKRQLTWFKRDPEINWFDGTKLFWEIN